MDPESRGAEMFARYAHAPNALGYCGPPLGATLRDGSVEDVRLAATKFSGAWPYLRVLSVLTGIADPKACQCGEVLKGVLKPWECKVFGTACTPETPIGTCMVSPEGACAAYYNFGRMHRDAAKLVGQSGRA